jgi:hypothetical protein
MPSAVVPPWMSAMSLYSALRKSRQASELSYLDSTQAWLGSLDNGGSIHVWITART